MWTIKETCPRSLCRVLVAFWFVASFAVVADEIKDFISNNTLPDGEVEVRIHYKGISAKETSVERGLNNGLKLRQLSDGKHFIQLIYDSDNLIDCEIVHRRDQVKTFLLKFKNDLRFLISTSNVTIQSLDDTVPSKQFRKSLNYRHLRKTCTDHHNFVKNTTAHHHNYEDGYSLRNETSRKKRALLIAPGTLWCGKSNSSSRYTELGAMSRTDMCCRKHDSCKLSIPDFTRKYNYYNHLPFTLSHCHCDRSFRACLKMVDTSDSNLVGKLFFNVVQTKCFVLKPKKKCVRRSYWGKCEKHKIVKQAILRNNLPY